MLDRSLRTVFPKKSPRITNKGIILANRWLYWWKNRKNAYLYHPLNKSSRFFMVHDFHIISVLLMGMLMGCSVSPPSTTTEPTAAPVSKRESVTSGNIHIAVDATFQPIVESQIHTFMAQYPESKITAHYMPGEKAIETMLNEDSIRLVITTRELRQSEKSALKEQLTSAKTSLLAKDAVALVVNKANPDTVFSIEQIKGILDGSITSWKEIDPASGLGDIHIIFDNAQSSTVQFLQDTILGTKPLTQKNVFDGNTNVEVLEYVKKDRAAIGIIGVSWISDQDDKEMSIFKKDVSIGKIQNRGECSYGKNKFYQPYQGYIDQDCYPFTRHVFAIHRETFVGLGTGFIAFLGSDPGQRIIHKAGLVPERAMTRLVRLPGRQSL